MNAYFKYLLFIIFITKCECVMEGFIIGGHYSAVAEHPYTVFLAMKPSHSRAWICGGSIINQRIILTAAHCLDNCKFSKKNSPCVIVASVGHSNKNLATTHLIARTRIHEGYNEKTIERDLCLLLVSNNIVLNSLASRVVLMRGPPYREPAVVSGWGVSSANGQISDQLKSVEQTVIRLSVCRRNLLAKVPAGTLCAGKSQAFHGREYPDSGDSGSPLVVRNLIQIGLVSFKCSRTQSMTVYTDVGYYFFWIREHAKRLYCHN